MLDELAHRVELLAARGAADNYYTFPALRDRRWLVNERVPRVPTQFGLNRRDERPSVHAGSIASSLLFRHVVTGISVGKLWQ